MRGKNISKLMWIGILACLLSCQTQSPIAYYNLCTGGMNSASAIATDVSNNLNRLYQVSLNIPDANYFEHYQTLLDYQKGILEELKGSKNNEAQKMIVSTSKYMEFAQKTFSSERFKQLLSVMESSTTVEQKISAVDKFSPFIDQLFDTEKDLYESYYEDMSTYASANNIDETLWKRDL